ncbi:GNAT family N-acetyltransferase [Ornithinimicrobium pratense]|uniref:GNAT family N-acetyltransferase n=1 Tax=Ornithinimicrobium pratense TaxID=2593973 RepID=A0A5J6V5Z8_9MICO|nr:GNAT family N-acetyltransferase [Ornithinimicrobium pratense]QFG68453.1 GNAT family N-acetyltransferase [Ornithinimicrobium pratense]
MSAAAGDLALRTAQQCGLTVEMIHDPTDAHEAAALLQQIWRTPLGAPVPPELLISLDHTGNYAALARHEGRIVAASAAFRAGDGSPHLHSHITGVADSHRGRSVGYAMKLHQRAWAIDHGYSVISWTFDPMQARNAYFNVVKLGARLDTYLPDFYGPMGDAINQGALSDRGLLKWDLFAPASARDLGTPEAPGIPGGRTAPVPLLEVADDGALLLPRTLGAPLLTIAVPADVGHLRRTDPDRALRWHHGVRDAFVAAFARGYEVIAFHPDHSYILRKTD